MSKLLKKKLNLVLLFALIFISGCGGGGGSATTPDEPDPIPSQIHQYHHAQIILQ